MAANEIREGDIGTVLTATLKDDSTIVDVSGTDSKKMLFRKPSGKTMSRDASFVTDGTDGQLKYTTVAGDLSETGIWEWQVRVTFPTGTRWTSDVETFEVFENVR